MADGQICKQTHGRTDIQTDEQIDGHTDGQTEKADIQRVNETYFSSCNVL